MIILLCGVVHIGSELSNFLGIPKILFEAFVEDFSLPYCLQIDLKRYLEGCLITLKSIFDQFCDCKLS